MIALKLKSPMFAVASIHPKLLPMHTVNISYSLYEDLLVKK